MASYLGFQVYVSGNSMPHWNKKEPIPLFGSAILLNPNPPHYGPFPTQEEKLAKTSKFPLAYKIALGILMVGTGSIVGYCFAFNMYSMTAAIAEISIASVALCIIGRYHANVAWDAYKKKKEKKEKMFKAYETRMNKALDSPTGQKAEQQYANYTNKLFGNDSETSFSHSKSRIDRNTRSYGSAMARSKLKKDRILPGYESN